MRSIYIVFIIFSIFLLFFPSNSSAIQIVQLDQAKVRLSIKPGGNKTGTINITNPTKDPKHIRVYLEDWRYLPVCDGTKDFKPAGTEGLSASRWISFVPAELDIPAYGKGALNYTVKVPPEASGAHYAVLFFETFASPAQESAQEGVTVNVAIRVASLFYLEPEGTIKREAKIGNLQVVKKEDRYYISADFQNTGNTDITTKGTFFIIDLKGMVYARGDFNDLYTFAGDSAGLTASWKEALPKGKYDLVLTLDVGRVLEEANLGRGPVITKESELEVGDNGEIIRVGGMR